MEDPSQEALVRLAELLTRASWRLRKNERKELSPFGLTFAQARALRAVVAAGQDRIRIGDLAGLLEIAPRSATTMVDGLEVAGLVIRRTDPSDRRSILLEPTSKGRDLIDRLTRERRASAEAVFAPLSDGDRAELLRLLRSITEDS